MDDTNNKRSAGQGPQPAPEPLATNPERMLKYQEIARLIGVYPDTVRKWARRGRLPVRRVGRRIRFLWSEVCAAMGANRTGNHDANGGPQ